MKKFIFILLCFSCLSTVAQSYRYLRLKVNSVIGTSQTQVELYDVKWYHGTTLLVDATPFWQSNLPAYLMWTLVQPIYKCPIRS